MVKKKKVAAMANCLAKRPLIINTVDCVMDLGVMKICWVKNFVSVFYYRFLDFEKKYPPTFKVKQEAIVT